MEKQEGESFPSKNFVFTASQGKIPEDAYWGNLPTHPITGTTVTVFDVLLRRKMNAEDVFQPGWFRGPRDGLFADWVYAAGYGAARTFKTPEWEWGIVPSPCRKTMSSSGITASEMERFAVLPDKNVVLPKGSYAIEISEGDSGNWQTVDVPIFGKLEKMTQRFSIAFRSGLNMDFGKELENSRLRCVNRRGGKCLWEVSGFELRRKSNP